MAFKVPERFRMRYHPAFGKMDESLGCNGVFQIPYATLSHKGILHVIVSDGSSLSRQELVMYGQWEHVSVVFYKNGKQAFVPDWDMMCFIKDMFWDEEDCVVQYHPPKSDYVNNCKEALHLWRPVGVTIPRPPSVFVGFK